MPPGFDNLDVITERLKIPRSKSNQAIEFLLRHALIKEVSGKFEIGPTLIHLESDSPNIPRHHQNWRNRAFLKYEELGKEDAVYTAPITLSKKDATIMRERVLKFISETLHLIKDSPSEELFCLCLDWYRI